MKKYLSLLLLSIILITVAFGCNGAGEIERTDYNVNEKETITIGVIVPTSGDNKNIGDDILEGLNFAKSTAPAVNIDKRYELNLSVYDTNGDVNAAAAKLIEQKVAAVVCYGGNAQKTDEILKSFETVNTPLLFVDNNSKNIASTATAFSMSVPTSYQASVASKFLKDEGYSKVAVVYEDNEYYKEFSASFKSAFGSATEYPYADFNASSVTKNFDCAYVIGNNKFAVDVTKQLKSASAGFSVMMPEMFDKNAMASDTFNGCYFLSKFETDNDNHYATDFISFYTQQKGVSSSEITSAIAYGYDAYIMVYGSLAHFNPMGSDPLAAVKNGSSEEQTSVVVTTSQMVDILKKEPNNSTIIDTHMLFDENGSIKPAYVFVDNVDSGVVSMHKKFVY